MTHKKRTFSIFLVAAILFTSIFSSTLPAFAESIYGKESAKASICAISYDADGGIDEVERGADAGDDFLFKVSSGEARLSLGTHNMIGSGSGDGVAYKGVPWSTFKDNFLTKFNESEKKDKIISISDPDGTGFSTPYRVSELSEIVDERGYNCLLATASKTEYPTKDDDNKCQTATSLGWILCPLIDLATEAASTMYTEILEERLQVKTALFEGGGASIREAWSTFRNIANIILIIFILFVVISQVTGYGIDNYGIKKTLPKIIVAAILINFSFIICQLAVDLSNILGRALNDMFMGLAERASETADLEVIKDAAIKKNHIWTGIAGGGITIGILAGITATGGWALIGAGLLAALAAALPAIIGGVISVVISIAFIFILLSARQAAIVLLVALAPLAFVCYMLPNAKNIFNKWLTAMKGLLLLYPICGAMVGGCTFASVILLRATGTGFWDSLVALLVGVVPYFFIPTLLRSSMKGIGNLGNRLSGIGQRFGRFAGSKARGLTDKSGAYRALNENAQRLRASTIQNKYGARLDAERAAAEAEYRTEHGLNATQPLTDEQKKDVEERATKKLSGRTAMRLAEANQALNDLDKADSERRLKASSSYVDAERVRTEANRRSQMAANATVAAVASSEAARNEYMRGVANQASFTASEGIKAASQFAKEYRIDGKGNVLTLDAKGNWRGIDKNGRELSYSADEAKDFRRESYADAKSRNMDAMRAGDYGRTGAYADTKQAERAREASNISGLNQSLDAVRSTIQGGNEAVLKLQHDQAANSRTVLQAQANEGAHELSYTAASQMAKTQKYNQSVRDYTEQFALRSPVSVQADLQSAIRSKNTAMIDAAASALAAKGKEDLLISTLNSMSGSAPTSIPIDSAMALRSSGSQFLAGFGKWASKQTGVDSVTMNAYLSDTSSDGFMQTMAKQKNSALTGWTEDSLKAFNGLLSTPGAFSSFANNFTYGQLVAGMQNNPNEKAKTQIESILRAKVAAGATSPANIRANVNSLFTTMTTTQIGALTPSQLYSSLGIDPSHPNASTLARSAINSLKSTNPALATKFTEVAADDRIRNIMDTDVRSILGI